MSRVCGRRTVGAPLPAPRAGLHAALHAGLHAAGSAALRAAVLAALLTGCTPLYLPPVPGDALVPESRLRLSGASEIAPVAGDALRLRLEVLEVPDEGWLAVQWFGPAGPARASESVWLTPADAGRSILIESPAPVAVGAGEWRAVVSWYGTVVRQFLVLVPATPASP